MSSKVTKLKLWILFYFSTNLEIFKEENLAKRPLSRYTTRALQNRHLEVLVTLLMLKIESEQEEYRKLMRLAEELCIEDFDNDKKMQIDGEEVGEILFKKESPSCWEGIEEEEILKLKALCHVRNSNLISPQF